MSAVSGTIERPALTPDVSEMHRIRWTEREFVFEIESPDEQICRMAVGVFPTPATTEHADTDRRWTIEPVGRNGELSWMVSGYSETSSMIPSSCQTRQSALQQVELDALDWLINNVSGEVVVHAALLSKNNHGIVIAGPSLAGKSTLATALWRSGWSLLSDDLVFIDVDRCKASPAPRRVSLRYGSKDLVGDPVWKQISNTPSCIETEKGLFFHPHEVSVLDKPHVISLSAIFFLARRDAAVGAAEIQPINPAKASLSLLPYSFNVRALPFVEGLRRISPLMADVPAFDLGRGELPAMISTVESAIG